MIRADHGYWGAQMIAPYVSEEVAWAVQISPGAALFRRRGVGYTYPEDYDRFFGPDYLPPEYIRKIPRRRATHRWYMTARLVTINDIYSFDDNARSIPEIFTDIIGRNFREPQRRAGLRQLARSRICGAR